jgi:long-chain acyl-CoA synthetase
MCNYATKEVNAVGAEGSLKNASNNVADGILARGDDSAEAIFHKDSALTYAELRRQVSLLASGLWARSHQKGARVGIWSENSAFFVTAYLGIIRAGLVAVPFQTDLTHESFVKIVKEASIGQMLVSQRFLKRLRPWAEQLGVRLLAEGQWQEQLVEGTAPLPEINPRVDLAALMFTSGSTGQPKGVMVTHRNIECNTQDIVSYLGLGPSDRVMVVLPFHYCFGVSLLHTHLRAGGSVVLNNNFRLYPEMVLQEMQQRECTGLAGVPSTYQILLRKSRFKQLRFPNLRWFQQAGGKLPNACIAEILETFPTARYFLMYGQTEATARLSYLPPERLHDKLGSIGCGLASTSLEVLKPDGTPVVPGSAEVGEIVATGDNITLGYWNDPEETRRFFKGGRLHTGDIARVDAEGFIYIVEREREMIKSGGNRVSAKEVEDVIAEMAAVVEVAVLGVPHELLGEAIQAVVVAAPASGLQAGTVEEHCRKRLPPFKVPTRVVFLPTLPHNSSGKVLKAKLKEMLVA